MLREIIDKYYLDRQKAKEQKSFYISEAGKCPRQIFFKFKNVPRKEMEANILRLFDHGDHMHQLIMKPLLSTRDVHIVSSEVDIPPQQLVRGRADAIVSDGRNLYVLDIKSMNSMVFKALTEPKEENVQQIQLYLHYFKIPKGILLYVNKDNLELKEFIIEYNAAQSKELLNSLASLKKQIDSNIIPCRISDYPDNWQCRYCQFKEVCDMGAPDEMNWKEFKTKIQGFENS
ncbi:hypothetical protein AMJ47_02630 [Parcubacteria bacterium DG_72]|nr:MAG: hypothetical protein AMJ47_02630 [Parcubacteria bacterium DG_72]